MSEMSFWNHVEAFRKMAIKSVLILVVAFLFTSYYVDNLTEFLLRPLRLSLHTTHLGVIVYHSVFEKAWVQVDVSILWAIIFSSPLWFYQIWAFIRPALHGNEARAVKPFIILGWFLFALGMTSGYLIMPYVFNFLSAMGVQDVQANISLRDYVSNISNILLFLGVIFQFPNVLLILGFMGIVTKQFLRSIRRYVYVGLSIFAAIFSPPDVISMLSVWIPLLVLYEIGILGVAWIVHPYLRYVNAKETVTPA